MYVKYYDLTILKKLAINPYGKTLLFDVYHASLDHQLVSTIVQAGVVTYKSTLYGL